MALNEQKRIERLEKILATLRRGKSVQNRQLRTVLGDGAFARFEDEWRQQQELREDLKNKPIQILEYEQRLKAATFTYSKADSASARGRRATATKLFAAADAQFELLAEFVQEQISGDHLLELWLDRNVHFDAGNAPASTPENFPCVITSRSLKNMGGGWLDIKRTKLQVKCDVVEREIEMLTLDDVDELALLTKRQAAALKMKKLMDD